MIAFCIACGSRAPESGKRCPKDGAPAVPTDPDDPWSGRLVDQRYRLLDRIGTGGIGTVYRAVHVKLRRSVAVKLLRPEYAANPQVRARFAREARAASRLDHPGCVDISDFATYGQHLLLAMELLEGHPLTDELRSAPLPAPRVMWIAGQLLDALHHAHERGVIHRDLKPGNIFLAREAQPGSEEVKLLDFGLAKIIGPQAEDSFVTADGTIFGTASYIAPEQVVGEAVGPGADVYASSAVIFEMLTGEPPYTAFDPARRAYQHVFDPVPDPRERNRALSDELAHVVTVGLGKIPEKRFQTAGALKNALLATPEGRAFEASEVLEIVDLPEVEPRPALPETFFLPGPVAAHGAAKGFLPLPGRTRADDEESTFLAIESVDPETAGRRRRVRRLVAAMFVAGWAVGVLFGGGVLALLTL